MEAVNWEREEKLERVRRKKLEWHGVAACRSLLIEVVKKAITSSHEEHCSLPSLPSFLHVEKMTEMEYL